MNLDSLKHKMELSSLLTKEEFKQQIGLLLNLSRLELKSIVNQQDTHPIGIVIIAKELLDKTKRYDMLKYLLETCYHS